MFTDCSSCHRRSSKYKGYKNKEVLSLTNRKFEMEERNKQKVKINFEMYYMLACTWTFSDPEKENLIQV